MQGVNCPGFALISAISLVLTTGPCLATATLAVCRTIDDATTRLDCYDRLAGRSADAETTRRAGASSPPAAQDDAGASKNGKGIGQLRTLTDLWSLDKDVIAITDPQPHRPIYLIGRWSNDVNEQPGNPARGPAPPAADTNPAELKFQLSFKTELLPPAVFKPVFDNLRLWFAYTQQSHWQVLDTEHSRPFRETNYEPELILTYGNSRNSGTYAPDLVNLGFVHQSNGRSEPESRGWNRLYLQAGWQGPKHSMLENVSLLARGWWSGDKGDNPDIDDYAGRGDLVLRWQPNKTNKISLLARHNLRLNPSRGFLQADWAIDPGEKYPALHLQMTSGYGESLIDYNHRQRTVGIGLSFGGW